MFVSLLLYGKSNKDLGSFRAGVGAASIGFIFTIAPGNM
jgi:hypothetical protein